jgi:hypothetical protein
MIRPNLKFIFVLVISICAGLFLAWMDSRPGWDDSGITAGLIVLTAALFGYLYPVRPWIWALSVSSWIPLHAIILSGDFKMLLVCLFGFAGSYLGAAVKSNNPAEPK